MDPIGTVGMAAIIPWQYMQIQSMLFSITQDNWVYAAVPIVMCGMMVHLLFRHFFSIAWFSFKIFISLLVYVQFRDVVASFIGQDPLSIEQSVFGIPPGTIELTKLIGIHLVKTRILANLAVVCPSCLKYPIPQAVKYEETQHKNGDSETENESSDSETKNESGDSNWIDMVRDVLIF